jgi:hypothetical protein
MPSGKNGQRVGENFRIVFTGDPKQVGKSFFLWISPFAIWSIGGIICVKET